MKKKTGPPANDLATVDAAKTFVDSGEVVVVGFFKNKDGPEAKIFKNVAAEMDDFVFGITSEDAVYSELKASKDGVILFKKVLSNFFKLFLMYIEHFDGYCAIECHRK